jgi:hypothetical protein
MTGQPLTVSLMNAAISLKVPSPSKVDELYTRQLFKATVLGCYLTNLSDKFDPIAPLVNPPNNHEAAGSEPRTNGDLSYKNAQGDIAYLNKSMPVPDTGLP